MPNPLGSHVGVPVISRGSLGPELPPQERLRTKLIAS